MGRRREPVARPHAARRRDVAAARRRRSGGRGKPIGFAQILKLATSKAGWAAYGLPTFGSFKLGHTNPDFSTAGLAFVTAQYYTAAGKTRGPDGRRRRRAPRSASRCGRCSSRSCTTATPALLRRPAEGARPGYISAVAMEEVTLLDYNRTRREERDAARRRLPRGRNVLLRQPAAHPARALGDAEQARAATVFERWLADEDHAGARRAVRLPARRPRRRSRPRRSTARTRRSRRSPRIVLGLPEPRVLAAIKSAWHEDRKPANVEVVVDVSGSMGDGGQLAQAKKGLRVFLRQFSPRDRVGLLTFSSGQPGRPDRRDAPNRPLLVESS